MGNCVAKYRKNSEDTNKTNPINLKTNSVNLNYESNDSNDLNTKEYEVILNNSALNDWFNEIVLDYDRFVHGIRTRRDDDYNHPPPFEFGGSGDPVMDDFISEKKLKWIPYNKFKNIEYLDEGGFSIIYKAILSDKSQDKEVILKCLKTLNDNLNEFLNEWKYHESCLDSYEIINLHGFTKDPNTSNYMVVIDYANQGNLRRNLTRIIEYNWKQKLYLLYKIISGLHEIHNQNLVHCDFHDGNILNHKNEEYKKNKMDKVYISDLGLCQPIKSIFKKDNIYGVIPFMAPEILRGETYTSASDIYSFSMIMWEFTSGVPPFNNRAHDLELSVSICKGERPKIIENTPQCYVNLMKKCWNNNPFERPSASEVLKIIEKWIYIPFKMGIKDISEEIKSNVMEFINAPIINNELITEYHPQAYRTSRLLNFTSKKLNEILNNEYLDDVSTFNDTKSLLDTNTHENTEID